MHFILRERPEVRLMPCMFLLVQKLSGDPAEVVGNARKKHGVERYRRLAQLCDSSAGARNWSDAQLLYHPAPASSMSVLLGKLTEWKNLETRCQARAGESVPPTLRTLVLRDMCPRRLYDT